MRLSSGFVVERIEDRVRPTAELEREPERRGRLGVGQLEPLSEKCFDFAFLPGLRLQANEQRTNRLCFNCFDMVQPPVG